MIADDLEPYGLHLDLRLRRGWQVPVLCRGLAIFIAVPFIIIILLDIVAYREHPESTTPSPEPRVIPP